MRRTRAAQDGKPQTGARLDHAHPLARGLRAALLYTEGAGAPRPWDALRPGTTYATNGSLGWTTRGGAFGRDCPALAGQEYDHLGFSPAVGPPYSVTVRMLFRQTQSTFPNISAMWWLNTTQETLLRLGDAGVPQDQIQFAVESTKVQCSTLALHRFYTITLVVTAGAQTLYLDGVQDGTASAASPTTWTQIQVFRDYVDGGRTPDGVAEFLFVHDRALSAAEAAALAREPYDLVWRPQHWLVAAEEAPAGGPFPPWLPETHRFPHIRM